MPSRLVYAQLQTLDPVGAKNFYQELCGWTMKDDPPGAGPPYTEAVVGAEAVAGIMPLREPGGAAHWLLYLSVDDVDSASKKAEHLGAKILLPPMDIPAKDCRISMLTDPGGARFALRGPLSSRQS